MGTISSALPALQTPLVTASATSSSSSTPSAESPVVQDAVELSLAGRIALGVGDGLLTSSQGQQRDTQLQSINQQIQSGGSDISQLQSQLSQQIYGDGHNGATIPTDITVTTADVRDFVEAGRVAAQESAGHLTSSQASQFFSQIGQIYQQSQGGATAAVTNQAQNQLSAQIFDTAHNFNTGTPSSS